MKDLKTLPPPEKSLESTIEKVWKPTPAMQVWLDAAIRSDSDSITKISEESGLDRKNWYKWIKDDNFLLWYKREWDKRIASESWKLDKIGLNKAGNDFKYWESMQKRVGNLIDQPKTLQQFNLGNEGNTITFVTFKNESTI